MIQGKRVFGFVQFAWESSVYFGLLSVFLRKGTMPSNVGLGNHGTSMGSDGNKGTYRQMAEREEEGE